MERNRRKEGHLIKKAVRRAIPDANVRVSAGQGTAWGWWTIYVEASITAPCTCTYETWGPRKTCKNCQDRWREIMRLGQAAAKQSGATTYDYTDDMGCGHSEILVEVTLQGQNQPESEATA